MEIKGKVIGVLPIATGDGKNGKWASQDFVVETDGQYPKKACLNLFGDKIDQFLPKIGEDITVQFDVESKEYNGRWYTNLRAYKVEKVGVVSQPASTTSSAPVASEGVDLPF